MARCLQESAQFAFRHLRRHLRLLQRLQRVLHRHPRLRREGVHVARDVEVELVLLDLGEVHDTGVLRELAA